ncbi:hypothetical protein WJX72_003158 [[Myrmecia] bisecta]|uniref:Chlorophyll a-b binding protein, chloroplastic n=1 Tax=[Myrmecia] bisecta TaxID=41462 RepID=A0AAW1R5Q7_9CHLO
MAAAMLTSTFVGTPSALARTASTSRPARQSVRAAAASGSKGLWLPGTESPPWLKGDLPGDRGFDPLGLGSDPDRLKWYAEGEKTNGRWAMAAVAGILGQELLGVEPRWYAAGAKEYALPPLALLGLEAVVLGFLELKRYQGWKETGKSGLINSFPFDPVGLNSDSNAEKEIKNGRLAMVAFLGFAVQALVTREGPIEGLKNHLADPFGHNFITNIANIPNVLSS